MYGCWLTVNRSCNIRCKWCYAAGTGFKKQDDMDFDSAKKIVDFCEELKIKDIIIIGGEPTIYPYILDLISYISKKGIKTVLVTNGIIFSQKTNIKKYIEAGLNSFSISLKANNQAEYLEVTGKDCFSNVIECIKNLRELNANFSVSQVLTAENIPTLSEGLKIFKEAGAKNFSFDFCHNFMCSNVQDDNFIKENNPYVVADLVKQYFPSIETTLKDCKYSLLQGLPLCVWDKEVISSMVEKGVISSICQLLAGNGIIFDTDLSLIPCNAMYELKYGKFEKDFYNEETFNSFMQNEKTKQFFQKLRGIPDMKCLDCSDAGRCGGGCVANWTNYSFEELNTIIKEDYERWKKKKNNEKK